MTVSVGIDLVEVAEVRRDLDRWGDRLAGRLLTAQERAIGTGARDPARALAAALAAKEAVIKSLRIGPDEAVAWTEIEVLAGDGSAAAVVLLGGARRLAGARGIHRFSLTTACDRRTALATVVADL